MRSFISFIGAIGVIVGFLLLPVWVLNGLRPDLLLYLSLLFLLLGALVLAAARILWHLELIAPLPVPQLKSPQSSDNTQASTKPPEPQANWSKDFEKLYGENFAAAVALTWLIGALAIDVFLILNTASEATLDPMHTWDTFLPFLAVFGIAPAILTWGGLFLVRKARRHIKIAAAATLGWLCLVVLNIAGSSFTYLKLLLWGLPPVAIVWLLVVVISRVSPSDA